MTLLALLALVQQPRHWAFERLRRPDPPLVRDAAWVKNLIDRFILADLEARGLKPAAEAPPERLVRRLSFVLTGLPGEDADPERVLASPHYGERWARHWLDVARYADSSGYESDFDQPAAHAYRDFVIRAFNDDLPFDRFARWQVAGDLLEPDDPAALAATGFCTVGPYVDTLPTDLAANRERYRYDELDDILSTTAQAFLGLTLGCARCHDHKFDPIPQREYYQMAAFFAGTERRERALSAPHRRLEEWLVGRRAALRREKIAAMGLTPEDARLLFLPVDSNIVSSKRLHDKHGKGITFDDDQFREWLSGEDRARWDALVEQAGPAIGGSRALALAEAGPAKAWWLGRGDPEQKKEEVGPGFLSVVTAGSTAAEGRAALAAWLTDVDRGAGSLLARVIVNRLWQHHFGEGLVRTPGDFGTQGERPTHPELLDWLASELVARGWRLKEMHRLIVSSATWRQGRRPLRLEAEALRDALLAASGRLDRTLYGPAVRAPIPPEAIVTRTKNVYPADLKDEPHTWRRSIYLFVKRSVRLPMMETHDAPNPSAGCGRRDRTTVAPQALTLLNAPFVRACAVDFARRIATESEPRARIDRAWRLALGRGPTAEETGAALRFVEQGSWEDLCQVLFTLNEFLYVD